MKHFGIGGNAATISDSARILAALWPSALAENSSSSPSPPLTGRLTVTPLHDGTDDRGG